LICLDEELFLDDSVLREGLEFLLEVGYLALVEAFVEVAGTLAEDLVAHYSN